MRRIKGVIFDMDGTLLDTERVYHRAWREAARRMHFDEVETALAACTGCNGSDTRRYFEQHFADVVDYDAYTVLRNQCYEEIIASEGLALKQGAVEILQWLKAHGIATALGTSTLPPRVMFNLESSGLLPYFDVLVTGDMVERGKPDPETFLLAARMLGVEPCHCMGVEDSFNGVRAVHAAGMYTVMVPDLLQPDETLCSVIDSTCENLLEIKPLIEKINREE